MKPHVRNGVGRSACRAASLVFFACATLVWPVLGTVDFSREILPILSENCFYCHGPDVNHRKGKLRLDLELDAKKDREGKAAIVPGHRGKSLLVSRILTEDEDDLMPPPDSNKTLTPDQIALLQRWIDEGAEWGEHWAFTPIIQPQVPPAPQTRHPIDSFVIRRLAEKKLHPSPRAEKTTLIRRATLDLTGLPPTPEEVKMFLDDPSPDAYEKVIDRLLASRAYGERMAWDWMEVARYADSNGYQNDADRTMWPWRDWVINSFNANLPYDRFTLLQLAGDLLPGATEQEKLATAFCRNHPINGEGGRIAEENRVDYVMDMTETTGTAWLGLTFNCTRCHDHKFDPLTRQDYYGLFAFFNQTPVNGGGGDPQTPPILEVPDSKQAAQRADLQLRFEAAAKKIDRFVTEIIRQPAAPSVTESTPPEITKLLDRAASTFTKTDFEALARHFTNSFPEFATLVGETGQAQQALDAFSKRIPKVMVMEDQPKTRKTFVLQTGLYSKPLDEITANTPARLHAFPAGAPVNRLGLAQWLVSKENPLTPRVTVNRVWQMFFGTGLVKTSEDFGTKGEFPSHPDLLDWLAAEFRDSGWDVKRLVRLIVTSDTYQQSSRFTKVLKEADPENRLLGRAARFRMPSWMLRDQALAASGLLVPRIGGSPVNSYQPPGVWEEATFGKKEYKQDTGDALYRRSLYLFWRRIIGPTAFFDSSSRMTCTVKPTRNNTPLHSLTTLNDTTYVEAARSLAERALTSSPDDRTRAATAFRRVLARGPTPAELRVLLAALDVAREQFSARVDEAKLFLAVGESKRNESIAVIEHAAWTATCLAILNFDETLTRE